MTLIFTHLAKENLAGQLAYLNCENPNVAKKFAELVEKVFNMLKLFPKLGKAGLKENTLEIQIVNFPYVCVYTLKEDNIIVLRILYTRQNCVRT